MPLTQKHLHVALAIVGLSWFAGLGARLPRFNPASRRSRGSKPSSTSCSAKPTSNSIPTPSCRPGAEAIPVGQKDQGDQTLPPVFGCRT